MKNKFAKFVIATIVLFVASIVCLWIMQRNGERQELEGFGDIQNSFYYFNTAFGIIGLVLFNIVKILYDKFFNKINKLYIEKKKKVGMWFWYVWISLVFWLFVFLKSNIGGGLTDLYQFKYPFLHGIYAVDILFVLPLWNILYNIIKAIKKGVSKA